MGQKLPRNHLHFMSVGVIELFPLRSLMALPVVGERDSFVLNGTRRLGSFCAQFLEVDVGFQ